MYFMHVVCININYWYSSDHNICLIIYQIFLFIYKQIFNIFQSDARNNSFVKNIFHILLESGMKM